MYGRSRISDDPKKPKSLVFTPFFWDIRVVVRVAVWVSFSLASLLKAKSGRREKKIGLNHNDSSRYLAAGEGFEPSHTESESAVLPLHNPAKRKSYYTEKKLFVKNFFSRFSRPYPLRRGAREKGSGSLTRPRAGERCPRRRPFPGRRRARRSRGTRLRRRS